MDFSQLFTPKQKKFLDYLATKKRNGENQIPALTVLGKELNISSSSLREILELAKTLGLIEAHPRSGIEIQPYSFKTPVIKSLGYAVMEDRSKFGEFSDLRIHLEKSYFLEAAESLSIDEITQLKELIISAKTKLHSNPIQIPHPEHRRLHLAIYKNIRNEFVTSLLEAYWMMYESIGLDLYTGLSYLKRVWDYHEKIVEEISQGNFQHGFEFLVEHMEMIKDIQMGK
jgi:DNA-binding FadR family transcriptional regulator